MRKGRLKAFRVASLLGGVLALLLSPVVVVWKGTILLLFSLVAVLFPWAVVLNYDVAAGTRYWSFRSTGITEIGPSSSGRSIVRLLGVVTIIAAAFGHWFKWPSWWAYLFERGILAGPAIAIFLFGAASIYQTCIWLVERGATKQCSNNHDFPPFEHSCPFCFARKDLKIVTNHDHT